MRPLLDTHAFLWWVDGTHPVGRRAKTAVANPDNEVFLSIASCWAIAIKVSLGKLRLPKLADRFIADQVSLNGFTLLEACDAGDRATAIVDSVAATIGRTFDLLDRLTQETTLSPPTAVPWSSLRSNSGNTFATYTTSRSSTGLA